MSRPELFDRCIQSIIEQTYKNYHLFVCADTQENFERVVSKSLIKDAEGKYQFLRNYTPMIVEKGEGEAFYNHYCNTLKKEVQGGWFFYLDDDDILSSPGILEELSKHLTDDKAIICQFLRNGKPKPSDFLIERKEIIRGRIGGGCMVIHSKFKDLANWDNLKAADFRWIAKIAQHAPLKFIKLVLQITFQKGNGK